MSDDLPSDTDMLNWLERHPEIKVECLDGWWRVYQDITNGWACSTQHGLRAAFKMAMRRLA